MVIPTDVPVNSVGEVCLIVSSTSNRPWVQSWLTVQRPFNERAADRSGSRSRFTVLRTSTSPPEIALSRFYLTTRAAALCQGFTTPIKR